MTGFEAVAADIRAAAGQMRSAARGVTGADPSSEVGAVASALPGSESAKAAGGLTRAWEDRFRSWHDDATGHADRLDASADGYDASDYAADQRLRVLMHRTGQTAR